MSQSWREAQNKMNIVLVCSHSVEVDFDITSMYEDMNEGGRRGKERERQSVRSGKRKEGIEAVFNWIKTGMEISGDTCL